MEPKASDGFVTQTLIFPKDKWDSVSAAKKWARDHDYKDDVDETEDSWRMRQRSPGDFERLRTICINPGTDTALNDCNVKAVGGPLKKSQTVMTKSRLRMEIKEISAEGAFEGVLSPYGNVDEGGDVVEPGAYAKTLQERGNKVPLLWQHRPDVPIGELTLEDRKDGLWAKGQLLMPLPEAQKAYLLIKAKIVKGLSIGFESIKDAIEAGIRHLKEIKLYEGSIVTFPMNEMALITAVKGNRETKGDFNDELSEIQTFQALWQMLDALRNALYSLIWADLTREEKISTCETILQQFTDAYSAFWPTYLDALDKEYGETWARDRLEMKEGAEFSAGNISKIKAACDKIKSGHDELMALLDGKAGATTLQTKAATKSEPAEDHSAAETLSKEINEFRALLQG